MDKHKSGTCGCRACAPVESVAQAAVTAAWTAYSEARPSQYRDGGDYAFIGAALVVALADAIGKADAMGARLDMAKVHSGLAVMAQTARDRFLAELGQEIRMVQSETETVN